MDDDQSAFCQVRPVLADVSLKSLPTRLGMVMPARRAAGKPPRRARAVPWLGCWLASSSTLIAAECRTSSAEPLHRVTWFSSRVRAERRFRAADVRAIRMSGLTQIGQFWVLSSARRSRGTWQRRWREERFVVPALAGGWPLPGRHQLPNRRVGGRHPRAGMTVVPDRAGCAAARRLAWVTRSFPAARPRRAWR